MTALAFTLTTVAGTAIGLTAGAVGRRLHNCHDIHACPHCADTGATVAWAFHPDRPATPAHGWCHCTTGQRLAEAAARPVDFAAAVERLINGDPPQ